jgi:hypothetical protein
MLSFSWLRGVVRVATKQEDNDIMPLSSWLRGAMKTIAQQEENQEDNNTRRHLLG